MPRPKKCRKVCQMPQTKAFLPAGEVSPDETVILTVDEYEAIRLIDKEGFSQEECSAYSLYFHGAYGSMANASA